MNRDLLIAASPGELWAAFIEEGTVTALRVLRTGARARVGDVILGRVVALRLDLPAALVDIGVGRPAFLSAEDAEPRGSIGGLHEGQSLIVQVTKDARADKAAGVSMRARLAGRLLDLVPSRPGIAAGRGLADAERDRLIGALRDVARPDEGFVLRATAAGASLTDLIIDVEALRARRRAIDALSRTSRPPAALDRSGAPLALLLGEFAAFSPDTIIIDDRAAFAEARSWLARHRPELSDRLRLHREAMPLFEHYGVSSEITAALAPSVALPGGGALTVELTSAAVVIDVDSGRSMGGRQAEEAILAVNLQAARVVARQVRLRNLAGPIVIDFIGMRRRGDRDRVRQELIAALADDPDTEVLGWTRLGHLEVVRKRRQASLAEILFERAADGGLIKTPTTVALEALRALARDTAITSGGRPTLHLHPEVVAVLEGEASAARQELEGRLGRDIELVAEPGRSRTSVDIRFG